MAIPILLIVSLIILIVTVLIDTLRGLRQGIVKSSVRLGVIILSVISATIFAKAIADGAAPALVDVLKNASDDFNSVIEAARSSEAVLSTYIKMFAAPILFIFLFTFFRLIFGLIAKIIVNLIPLKSKHPIVSRAVGAAIGAVCGIVFTIIITAPLYGYSYLTSDAIDNLYSADDVYTDNMKAEGDTTVDDYMYNNIGDIRHFNDSYIKPSAIDVSGMVLYKGLGGKLIFDNLTTFTLNNKKATLSNELNQTARVFGDVIIILPMLDDLADVTPAQNAAIERFSEDFGNSVTLEKLSADMLSEMSDKWTSGEQFMDMSKPEVGEVASSTFDTALGIFKTSDITNIKADATTVLHVLSKLAMSGVLKPTDDYTQLLHDISDSGVIGEIIEELSLNERMAPLVNEISNLGVRALASVLGIPADASEQYDKLMNELADSINTVNSKPKEERAQALAELSSEMLKDYGVDVPDDVSLDVANAMLKDLGDENDVNSDSVKEFFKVYAASSTIEIPDEFNQNRSHPAARYLSAAPENNNRIITNPDGTISLPDGTVLHYYTISTIYTSGAFNLSCKDTGNLKTLESASDMVSCIITIEDLMGHGQITPETAAAEAKKIQLILNEAVKIADLVDSGADADELIDAIGTLMDIMHSSDILGADTTANILTAILQSSTIRDTTGYTLKEASELGETIRKNVESDNNGYKEILSTVSDAIKIIKAVNNENISDSEREAQIRKLMDDLTPSCADVLQTMCTESLMLSYNVPEENAVKSAEMSVTLFRNLSDFASKPGTTDADYDREAKAVNTLFNITLDARNSDDEYLFNYGTKQHGVTGKTANEITSIIAGSEVVSSTVITTTGADGTLEMDPFGIDDSMDDEDREQLCSSIQQYHAEHSGEKNIDTKLIAIGLLFNIDISF